MQKREFVKNGEEEMEGTQGRNKKLTGFAHELEKKKRAEDPWVDHGSTFTCKPMKSGEDASLFRKVFALHECTLHRKIIIDFPKTTRYRWRGEARGSGRKDVEAEGALLVRLTLCSRGTARSGRT